MDYLRHIESDEVKEARNLHYIGTDQWHMAEGGPGEEDGPWAEGFEERAGGYLDAFPINIGVDLASGPDVCSVWDIVNGEVVIYDTTDETLDQLYESNLDVGYKVGEPHD